MSAIIKILAAVIPPLIDFFVKDFAKASEQKKSFKAWVKKIQKNKESARMRKEGKRLSKKIDKMWKDVRKEERKELKLKKLNSSK